MVCAVLLGSMATPSRATSESMEGVYDLILEVKRDRATLSSALIGLEKDGEFFLPVRMLAQVVDFEANVDLDNRTVAGFYLNESNSYSIHVDEGYYTHMGQRYPLEEGQAFIVEQGFGIGDVYVSPEILNKIWPLDLYLDALFLTLEIRSKAKLPYELAKERGRLRQRRLSKEGDYDDEGKSDLPLLPNGYKMFSLPALNVATSVNWQGREGAHSQSLNVSGSNDLLKGEADYNFRFLNDSEEGLSFEDGRFLLTRKAFDKGDLPAGLKLVQAGDISTRTSRLVGGSMQGRGVLVSNAPYKQLQDFDVIIVEGFAEPGWEVELYRNQELIGFQTVDGGGEYRFEDVTLNFNRTSIRTVLYGPQGQIEEREEIYNISRDMLSPGQTTFEASILEQNTDLIPSSSNEDDPDTQGLAQNYRISRGITKWLSAFSTITETPTQAGTQRFTTLGLNISAFGLLNQVEFYKDEDDGTAVDFRTAANFAGVNLNLSTAFMSDFESRDVGFGDRAEVFNLDASADKSIKLPFGHLGLRLALDHDKYVDESTRSEFDASQTLSFSKIRLTHGTSTTLSDRKHQYTDGRLSATYALTPQWRFRTMLNYDLFPDKDLRNLYSELRYRDREGFTAAVDFDKNLQEDGGLRIGGQVGYDFDTFRSSIDVDRDADGEFRAALRTSFSLAPYGKKGEYIFDAQSLTNRSALNARVFKDKDYDGVYSEGDEPLPGISLDVDGRKTPPSNEEGRVYALGPTREEYEDITLPEDALANPFLVPNTAGYQTLVRAGNLPFVDFPVIEVGTIDGIVSSSLGPMAGVSMQLVDLQGEVVDTVATSFDGFYVFEEVRPGDYTIRIDPSYDQVSVPPRSVSVTSENLFPYGIDFQILEQAEEEACEPEAVGRITQNCQDEASAVTSGIEQPAHFFDGGEEIAIINRVRIGEHPGKIRLTLDLSAPAQFSITESDDGKSVVIELPDVGWEAVKSWTSTKADIITGFNVVPLDGGGATMVFEAVNRVTVIDSNVLAPEGDKGHRMYFDIISDN